MATARTVVYVRGQRVREGISPAEGLALAEEQDGMLWVGLQGATREEVIALGEELGLDRLGITEMTRTHQRSKLDHFGDRLFLVMQPAEYADPTETVHCHEVDVVVGDHLVFAVSAHPAVDLERMRVLLEQYPDILTRGPYAVLWAVCEYVTRGYRDVMDGIENDIDEIEEELFGDGEDVSHRIFALQREVIDLHHATAPLAEIIERLERAVAGKQGVPSVPPFAEVADRARYIDARVAAFRGTLDSALTIHATLVEQRRNEQMREMTRVSLEQNDQVKKVSSWAAIGFAPTLVAGVYGMNFRFMPELDQPWGYPFALALMVAASVGLYAVFKKRDWL